MEPELKASRITVSLHAVVAMLVGYVSPMLGNWVATGVGLVVLFAIGFLSEKMVAQKGVKFWFANGVIIYVFIWFITWTYFFNMLAG